MMYWRLQAKGYPASRAWLEETAWSYRMGLLGYAAFALSALTLSSQPFQANTQLFHLLTWTFFVVAHLPDFLAASAVRTGHTALNLALAILIATVNVILAWQDQRVVGQLSIQFPDAQPLLLTAASQTCIILGAFLVHGLINGIMLGISRLVSRKHVRTIAAPITPTAPVVAEAAPGEPEPPASAFTPDNTTTLSTQDAFPPEPETELRALSESPMRARPESTEILVPDAPSSPGLTTAPPSRPAAGPSAPPSRSACLPPAPPATDTIPYTDLPLPTFSLWDKLMGRHRQTPTPPAQPHRELIQLLLRTPSKELRPAIRFVSTVSIGGNLGTSTPLLLENPEDDLFLPNGTMDGRVLARFLSRMSAIRSFVPKTRLGRRTYRPIARRMSRRLYKPWQTWLRTLSCPVSTEVRTLGQHLLTLPRDEVPLVLCVGVSPFHLERATCRVLTNLLQKNAITQLVDIRIATVSPTPGPGSIPNPEQEQFLDQENQILSRLDIQPVHPGQYGIPSLNRSLLKKAAIIITVDEHSQNTLWLRLKASEPTLQHHTPPRILSLQTVYPNRFRALSSNRKQRASTLKKILPAIESSLISTILPYLLARASLCPAASPDTLANPCTHQANPSQREEVDAFRAALRTVCTPAHLSRKHIPVKNVLKLIKALASGDPAILLMHGIPESLLAHSRDVGSLDNSTLGRCLNSLPKARSLIPPERRKDYEPALRLLKQSAD